MKFVVFNHGDLFLHKIVRNHLQSELQLGQEVNEPQEDFSVLLSEEFFFKFIVVDVLLNASEATDQLKAEKDVLGG